MVDVEVAEIRGLLTGINNNIKEIKEDIKKIESNDSDKLQRISKTEAEVNALNLWREHHIQDNDETKTMLETYKEKFDSYKEANTKLMALILVGILSLLVSVIIDLLR